MKDPYTLSQEARDEGYKYFDSEIRPLYKDKSGKIDPTARGLEGNDADAFRHAYVSGVFTQEYGEVVADLFGRLNEHDPFSFYSNINKPESKNMDLWNNSVGRKYGVKAKDRRSLLKFIHEALKKGELITDPQDNRKYEGLWGDSANKSKPIIVISESKKGRNEVFYDLVKREMLTVSTFVARIENGEYPGYTVKKINGVATPVSKRDSRETNNLG